MTAICKAPFQHFRVGLPEPYRGFNVYPVFIDRPEPEPQYFTLKEAFDQKLIEITEIDAAGSVNRIRVVNKGSLPVLIPEGQALIGAKQNRTANTTYYIASKTETVIDVSCTEAGRWHYREPVFRPSMELDPTELRAMKMAHVKKSLERERAYRSRQGDVWNRVSEILYSKKVSSGTSALHDAIKREEKHVRDSRPRLHERQEGILVMTPDFVLQGMEFFAGHSHYAIYHQAILTSFTFTRITAYTGSSHANQWGSVADFLDGLRVLKLEPYPAINTGTNVRLEGPRLLGELLDDGTQPVHGIVLPDISQKPPRWDRPPTSSRIERTDPMWNRPEDEDAGSRTSPHGEDTSGNTNWLSNPFGSNYPGRNRRSGR